MLNSSKSNKKNIKREFIYFLQKYIFLQYTTSKTSKNNSFRQWANLVGGPVPGSLDPLSPYIRPRFVACIVTRSLFSEVQSMKWSS